jgi:hypothetical protein
MAIERIHSSDVQLFVNDQYVPAVESLNLSSSKKVTNIPRLGFSHIAERMLNADQSTEIEVGIYLTTGNTGVSPFYGPQQMQSGFLSTGKFDFKVKDKLGVNTISGGSLTSYDLNGSVGELVKGRTSYVGDGAIFTSVGALTDEDASTDTFGGFFRPKDIEITSTNGDEGIDSANLNIQDFSLSVNIGRNPVTRLGTRVPKFRYPELPSNGTLRFNVIKNKVTGLNISSLICESGAIKIDLQDDGGNSVMDFTASGCCLESVDESPSLDDNTTISFSYYFPIIK